MTRPQVEFLCPECEENCVIEGPGAGAGAGGDRVRACPACGSNLDLVDPSIEGTGTGRETGAVREAVSSAALKSASSSGGIPVPGPVHRCAVCGCPKLYVQKDFNRNAGLLVVAVTALVSGVVLMITHSTLWAMGVLGVVTVFDALVYGLLPVVTVCYRCEAVHRGFPQNPRHEGFDIHTAEEFAYGEK